KEKKSLKEKHKDISIRLSLIMSPRNLKMDKRNCKEFQHLLQSKCHYDSLIRDRKFLLADLDKELLELEKKLVKQNQIATKVKQANCSKQLQKQTEILELRLNTITVRFGTTLATNNGLRQQIESLHIQKAVLDQSYWKLHKKLDQQSRRLTTDVEEAAQAYKQWTDGLARISALKEMRRKELFQYNIELQRRNRALERDTKVKNFMIIKSTDRSELEERAKKKKALKAAQRAKRNQGESFENLEVAYMRMLELAENGNIDQMLENFIKREQKDFSCFNYATEMNIEMEKMQQRAKDLQRRIMALTVDKEYAKSSSLCALQELEQTLMEAAKELRWYEEACKKSNRLLDQLQSGIEGLYKVINYDNTTLMKYLEETERITDQNLLHFFGPLEQKTKELVLMESELSRTLADGSQPEEPPTNPLLDGTRLLRTMDCARLCPPPPTLDGITDAVDTLEVPLEHGQLLQLVLQSWKAEESNTVDGKKGRNSVKL
ncbi:CCD63 protein, partial [Centropus unirufus]|nr:CCD63 protein [Centropus unirufus]